MPVAQLTYKDALVTMKLATLADGSRDGQLVVVSRDLSLAHLASHIAGTLQQLLDDWNFISPQLEDLYALLNGAKQRHAFAFEPQACLAPLPRAYLFATETGLARSSQFLPPHGAVDMARLDTGRSAGAAEGASASAGPAGWQAHWVALTGDVAAGADADTALDGVRMLLVAATWGARGAVQATAFSPVVVTPDELGSDWQGGKVLQTLTVKREAAAQPQAASNLSNDAGASPGDAAGFGRRIATLARHQSLGAGSLVAAPGFEAGQGWVAGSRLHVQAGDGSLLGAIALHAT